MAIVRHQIRMIVLQTLFEADLTDHAPPDVLRRHLGERSFSTEMETFAQGLLEGVLAHSQEIDQLITQAAPNWPLEQMSRVDVNILRIAIYEMLFALDGHIPVKAAINEAVELAKQFGSGSSRRFVNGVLGTLAKEQGRRTSPAPKEVEERS